MYKSVVPDDIHLGVLKELADVVAKPLFIVFEKLWLSGEDPGDCKKRNIAPISKEGRKEDLGNYGLPVPRKGMEQVLLEETLRHM